MDTVTPEKRSWTMAQVKGRNTGPEKAVRSLLHQLGYRFRLQRSDLPGKPDIVLPKFKTVLFVHGCFWHRHGCKATTTPATNVDFWRKKFEENTARDRRHTEALLTAGWRVAVVWQCALDGKNADPGEVAKVVRKWLGSSDRLMTTDFSGSGR